MRITRKLIGERIKMLEKAHGFHTLTGWNQIKNDLLAEAKAIKRNPTALHPQPRSVEYGRYIELLHLYGESAPKRRR